MTKIHKISFLMLTLVMLIGYASAQEIKATFENDNLEDTHLNFGGQKLKRINSLLFDHTRQGVSSHYAQRLTGRLHDKIGLTESLSVKAGDTVQLKVFAKYWSSTKPPVLTMFGNFLIGVIIVNSHAVTAESTFKNSFNQNNQAFVAEGFKNENTDPAGYLNWLIFDEKFELIDGGYIRMSDASKEHGQNTEHELLESGKLPISTKGYVYTYLSNESEQDVYFDDFSIEHILAGYINTESSEDVLTEDEDYIMAE